MFPSRASCALAALVVAASAPIVAQTAPQFSVYPSYGAKFNIGSEKFSLVTSLVVYNISGQTYSDVTFTQTYPDGVSVKETYQRDVASEATGEQSSSRKVEGNIFRASLPSFRNRQYVVMFNELDLARRLNQITFPGVEILYTDGEGKQQTAKMQDSTYDLFIYSNVVGGLERFLKKYNNITFDFAKSVPERKEWEFAPVAASAQGRFATGIVGTFPGDDQYNGHFRVRNGPPGDTIQVIVVYRGVDKKEVLTEKDAVIKRLRDYLRWAGEFEFAPDDLEVKRETWKKYDGAWLARGRWVDTIKNRLGEGPVTARVFYGPREDVEYYVLGLGHGRGIGAEGSGTPKPENEARVGAEIDRLVESFKSNIVPLSYERRR